MKFLENTIFFDLDQAQIEVEHRVQLEIEAAARYGMSQQTFMEGRGLAVKEGISFFNYKKLFEHCARVKPDLDQAIIEEWYDIIRMKRIFPDTIPALELVPIKRRVMLTTGDPEFQNIKIDPNGLRDYFSQILIVPTPKCDSLADEDIPPGAAFADDSPREIDAMKLRHPKVFSVQVRNPAPWEHQKISEYKDAHAEDLYAAVFLIQNKHRLV